MSKTMTATAAKVSPASPSAAATGAAKASKPSRGSHTLLSSFVPKPGSAGASRIVTPAELAENCGIGSSTGLAWVSIHGQVFDITEFSRVHPGGEVIRLAAGRDCTCLVESYHPVDSIVKVEAALYSKATHVGVLQCEETCDVTEPSPAKGYQRPDDAFFVDVRARVDAYIKSTGASSYHSTYEALGVFEALCTLALYWYATWQVGYHGSWFWAVALGILTGRMGFLMHMGNHCAISRSPRLNKYIGWFMELAGSNSVIWGYEHQVNTRHTKSAAASVQNRRRRETTRRQSHTEAREIERARACWDAIAQREVLLLTLLLLPCAFLRYAGCSPRGP